MCKFRNLALLLLCSIGNLALHAQSVPGSGWSSGGVLPFRGYDFVIVKAPTRYILYYTKHPTDRVGEGPPLAYGRAFSTDLKTWTVDPSDICTTSGDLHCGSKAGVLNLSDGRIRMFLGGGTLSSMISSDGVTWKVEPGIRFASDPSSIYERGAFVLALASFVNLPDGSVRMYYEGGIVNGSPGTPDYYNSIFASGAILSAVSKDNGLTWVRDPGVRINPLVQGPVLNETTQNQFNGTDVTAVAVKEDGRTVYRIFAPPLADGALSYISYDGLSFALEGQVPTAGGDPKAIVLPDGRIWLIANQYPDAIVDTLVYGPQSLFLTSVKAGVGRLPVSGFAKPFESVLMGITGSSNGPVSFEAVAGSPFCPEGDTCPFHPEYYSFSPASGTPPFSTVVSYTGPPTSGNFDLYVHAKARDMTAAGGIYCMQLVLRPSNNVFCNTTETSLPLNKMTFAFSSGAAPSSQTSKILYLGGHGYPFRVSSSVPWATVSPVNGTAPMPITVTVDPATLAPGPYTGVITISAEGTTEQITVNAVVSAGPPLITAVRNAANYAATIAPNSFVTIFGSGFTNSPVNWSPITDLPVSLAGVSVRINGKDAFVSYADSNQVNVLAPPDTASGTVLVEVTAASGKTTANVTMAPVAPAWFTYTVGDANWIAALFGNTATYVAPPGSLGSQSQSAKAGDFLQLYANGLGATNPAAPAGVVLTTPYPLDDFSRVRVTIAGRPVPVQWAGLVYSGLYQVNVQVPSGLGFGDLPVVMMVDGQMTQGATLNFQ